MKKDFIVIDWGSSNIRAFLYINGQQADIKKSSEGVTVVRGKDCEQAFDRLTKEWFDKYGPLPVTMCGMVGSVNGWVDAQYLPCPVELSNIAYNLTNVEHSKGYDIKIIPGICVKNKDNYNVIRGEETQLAGAANQFKSNVYLMPGTHCKWVRAEDLKVINFRTAMTGELHSILMKYSLIGLGSKEQETSVDTFKQGLYRGYFENNLVPRLFEIRASNILGSISPSCISEYLSGLLIGAEIASMQKIFEISKDDGPITIIGNEFFKDRYAIGLDLADLSYNFIEGDKAILKGIIPIAQNRI